MAFENQDSWGIRKYNDVELSKILRDPHACEQAIQVATTEALARILLKEKSPKRDKKV